MTFGKDKEKLMIYLLEDDGNIRKFVLYALKTVGIEAEGFELPSEFWRAMKEAKPELVLLDIMLPEEDGLSVLKLSLIHIWFLHPCKTFQCGDWRERERGCSGLHELHHER